jgi:hypothetical protein
LVGKNETAKNNLKIIDEKFGSIKKKIHLCTAKQILNHQNMLRTILHNEIAVSFSPKDYDTCAGACFAAS